MKNKRGKDVEKTFLEPSFEYLVENGLENTSIRDLCKAMGVSSGSVYYWFVSKDDVYISAVKYGLSKIVNELFTIAFERMGNLEYFFDTFLDEVDKYKKEFRLVFQVTSSPVYGERMRNKAEEFKFMYEKYISMLSEMLGCDTKFMTSVVYMIMALLVDYVMWEDLPTSKMQLDSLYKMMKAECTKQTTAN
ncbi:MAG: TetR/AcrR family transcriptional regulator [Clostridia bacterium]|nr:TetR/AcrR family transcriptional regulator [Clostridia bacterium]